MATVNKWLLDSVEELQQVIINDSDVDLTYRPIINVVALARQSAFNYVEKPWDVKLQALMTSRASLGVNNTLLLVNTARQVLFLRQILEGLGITEFRLLSAGHGRETGEWFAQAEGAVLVAQAESPACMYKNGYCCPVQEFDRYY